MIRQLSREKPEKNRAPLSRTLSGNLSKIPLRKQIESPKSSFFLNQRPENPNLAESFSRQYLVEDFQQDQSLYKLLPSLKKKNLPTTFLSVKHAQDFTSKINPKPKKKIIKSTKKLDQLFPSSQSEISDSKEEKEELERIKALHQQPLPLNIFDPVLDLQSPKTMIETKKSPDSQTYAFSKWFNPDGSYYWRKCTVVLWDQLREKFLINWLDGGEKFASRINLRFEDEDSEKFELRITEAKKYKSSVESTYQYNNFVNCFIKEEPAISVKAVIKILKYLQGKDQPKLENYRTVLRFYQDKTVEVPKPSKFLWKFEVSHFVDESLKGKGFDSHEGYLEQSVRELEPFSMFNYKKQKTVSLSRIMKLLDEYKENWRLISKHIDYTMRKNKKNKVENSRIGQVHGSKRVEDFIDKIKNVNECHVLNDTVRIEISQKLNDILYSWESLSMMPQIGNSAIYLEDLLILHEKAFTYFLKEIQDAVFDIQYEIQNVLNVEDQRRIERNEQKLKSRAYSKQFVELEDRLPERLLKDYSKFLIVCNMKMENSIRKIVFQGLTEMNSKLSEPIKYLIYKLSCDVPLKKEDFELSGTLDLSLFKIDLVIDWSAKSFKFDPQGTEYCNSILKFIESCFLKLGAVSCFQTIQTGPCKNPPFLSISSEFPRKMKKLKTLISENVKLEFLLLDDFTFNLEKFNFIFQLKPLEDAKKYESDFNLDLIENEIFRLERVKIDLKELVGKNERALGIWKIVSESTLKTSLEILDKAKGEIVNILFKQSAKLIQEIEDIFQGVKEIVTHVPENLEELADIRDFIYNEFPLKIDLIEEGKNNIKNIIDVLESYYMFIPSDIYQKFWNCLSYSKNLAIYKENCFKTLESLLVVFSENLKSQKIDLLNDIQQMSSHLTVLKCQSDYSEYERYSKDCSFLQVSLQRAQEVVKTVNIREYILYEPSTDFNQLSEIINEFSPYCKIWFYIRDFEDRLPKWYNERIFSLHRDDIGNEIISCLTDISKLERTTFKNEPAPIRLIKILTAKLNQFRPYLPIIKYINSPGMKDRHWSELKSQTGLDISKTSFITLRDLIEMNILNFINQLESISEVANKELGLENAKKKMEAEWLSIKFNISPYKNSYILTNTENIWETLNEHLMRTITMAASPFIQFMSNETNIWKSNLIKIQEVLESWEKFQKNWQYLQPIFTNNDISKQLPQSASRFRKANTTWETIMSNAKNNPVVYEYCVSGPKLLEHLSSGNEGLDLILKSLNEYLMSKRKIFPRFYFLSNEELIVILSNSQYIDSIQKYIVKCFEAISSVMVEGSDITGMISPEGEQVKFVEPVGLFVTDEIRSIELWMIDLEKEMRASLKTQMTEALEDYQLKDIKSWVSRWPSQLIHTSLMCILTNSIEKSIQNNTLGVTLKLEEEFLTTLVYLVRGKLDCLERLVFSTMVVQHVYTKEVVSRLISKQVQNLEEFPWFSCMKYYLKDSEIFMSMLDCNRDYGYEYIGNSNRLVVTELTERCFLTLMSALRLNLGGAPEGPASTGKTETVKDLAKSLAKKCVVFNCSERLDHIYMAKFFTGLCYSGAWACFDEFNRIELDVLSVVGDMITSIQSAVQLKSRSFYLNEDLTQLDPTCAIFITMNPNYRDRSKLPNNIAVLFRPVAMMIPDYLIIIEISLFSFGFINAKGLAQKIHDCLRLASEQLSTQLHYDYGMRAISTIIKTAEYLKRNEPNENEFFIVLKAIKIANLPKFVNEDLPLFTGILRDLFPGVEDSEEEDPIKSFVRTSIIDFKLIENQKFINKVLQIYSTVQVRHSLMVIGESMSGKSTAISVLSKALSFKNQTMVSYVNPKSITLSQLYGATNQVTMDWEDGILAQNIRSFSESNSPGYKLIVLDGPVDALWIENMNTVMDDNKKLCLPNGEIIKLSPLIRIFVEVESLTNASPATISRSGMVFLDSEEALNSGNLIEQWCKYPPVGFEKHKETFKKLYFSIFLPSLKFWEVSLNKKKWLKNHITKNTIKLFESLIIRKGKSRQEHDRDITEELINKAKPEGNYDGSDLQKHTGLEKTLTKGTLVRDIEKYAKHKEHEQQIELEKSSEEDRLKNLFVFAVYWALSGSCKEDKKALSDFIFELSKTILNLPDDFYEKFYVDGTWKTFKSLVGDPVRQEEITQIFVPTVSLVSYKFIVNELVTRKVNSLISGDSGTGKTVLLKNVISELDKSFQISSTMLTISTGSKDIQNFLEKNLIRLRKGLLGPDINRFRIFMIDDLGMPNREKFGSQPALELLRTVIDRNELYDLSTLELRTLENVQYLGSKGAQEDSTSVSRFLSHFFVLVFSDYDSDSLYIILSSLLSIGLEGHVSEITSCIEKLAKGTISLYKSTLDSLLPTPLKNHYLFNFRDLANLIKGFLLIPPSKMQDPLVLYKLWSHECLRVFSDRLVNENDQRVFQGILERVLADEFCCDLSGFKTEIMFLNYVDDKFYQFVPSMIKVKKYLKEYLDEYNFENPNNSLSLLFFDYSVKHINRISRVMLWNEGSLLLIGVGGSGKTSLTKLSAFIQDLRVYQIKLTKTYSFNEWTEDIKSVLTITGLEDKKLVFLIRNNEIILESFLEVINSILITGYYQDIFTQEEISGINESFRMDKRYYLLSNSDRWSIFLSNIKKNLHIVLCMYPQSDTLRNRIRQFPALVNCCTIDWFLSWPDDALEAVAEYSLQNESIVQETEKRESVIKVCVHFHESVKQLSEKYLSESRRTNYVTPSHFINFLNTLKKLYKIKEETTVKQSQKYTLGINKLNMTQQHVQELRTELLGLKPILEQKTQYSQEILKNIQKETAEADIKREIVKKEQEASQAQTLLAEQIKKECQDELNKALPDLEAAIKALDILKRDDIDQIRSMREPPDTIKLVLEALAHINKLKVTKIKDPKHPNFGQLDYYEAGKKFLSVSKVIQKIKSFDRESLDEETIHKITPYMEMGKFHPDMVKNASRAAEGLCKWVRAMYKFYFVNKEVKPKQASLQEAEADLLEKIRLLKIKQDELAEMEEIIQEMRNKLNLQMTELRILRDEINRVEVHLDRAVRLIDQLGGERESWITKVKKFEKDLQNLLGDVLLSAAFITYLGPFFWSYREKCLEKLWVPYLRGFAVPCTSGFSLAGCVSEPITVQKWNLSGLPSDKSSIENAIIIELSTRYPLIIDPQRQAYKWLNKMLAQNGVNLVKTKFGNRNFNIEMDTALMVGSSLMIEDVNEFIDPILDPILLKQFFIHSNMKFIKIGETSKQYDESFFLYLFTYYSNPYFSPEIFTKTSVINFSITEEALCEQLLYLICRYEIPRETEERNRLVSQSVEHVKNMLVLEERILELLQLAGEKLLESEELINSLTQSKDFSTEVEKKLINTKHAEQKIASFQGNYKPVSRISALVYFCIADLANINSMYQYSMVWFISIFKTSMELAEKSKDINERIKNIKLKFRKLVYENIFHSLLGKDRVLFAFLVAVRLGMHEREILPWQWRFYLTGVCGLADETKNPTDFLSDKAWREVCQLDTQLKGLKDHMTTCPEKWKYFINTDVQWVQVPFFEEFAKILPEPFYSVTNIARLLIFRAVKPESLGVAVKSFIKTVLGEDFLTPKVFNFKDIIQQTSAVKPLILILTSGNDPLNYIKRFAYENNLPFKTASFGKGQEEKTEKTINEAISLGYLLLIQNCHLALNWVAKLETIIEDLSLQSPEAYNKDFRLILTSPPTEGFPSLLLQRSVKLILQPSEGLSSILLDIYSSISNSKQESIFYNSSKKPLVWSKLFFSLCFFHSVITERRMFGPVGWNVNYFFTEGDLQISYRQLFQIINNYEAPPFDALVFLTASCNYGGRVTDDWDRRTIMCILADYYRKEVLELSNITAVTGYDITSFDSFDEIMAQIRKFPQVQSSELLGLHPNAELSKAIRDSDEMCSRLLALKPQSAISNFDEEKETIFSMISGILGRINEKFDLDKVGEKYPFSYLETLSTVLLHEVIRYNILIDTIQRTLDILKKAYEGVILISREYEVLAESLLKNEVPEIWIKVSYSSSKKLASYIDDLFKRVSFFRSWVENARPEVFWISGFFFPQSFLSGVFQEYSRTHSFSIDSLKFSFEVMKEHPEGPPETGAYITGMFLEGASWEEDSLSECRPREIYTQFPVVWLRPEFNTQVQSKDVYVCPLYRTLKRSSYLEPSASSSNYIMSIELKSKTAPCHWVKRGVALFTQLDD